MSRFWSTEQAALFWQRRKTYQVFNDEMQTSKIVRYNSEVQRRIDQECNAKTEYVSNKKFRPITQNIANVNQVRDIANDLQFWANYSAWTFCEECNMLSTKILQYNFSKRPKNKVTNSCVCSRTRYIIPRFKDIPKCLLNLTVEDINILRPFYLFLEHYQRHAHGYNVKCCPIKLRISEHSVRDKINAVTDLTQKTRCENAYNHLMTTSSSRYSHFVRYRETILAQRSDLNLFNFKNTEGIECALWPNLYPYTSWCESVLSDSGSRMSSKVSFNTKLHSEIIDYGMHFELLQFQYDRWLYKTVSGAINTARFQNCSPARALDTKTFSATYWQWQHRYVLDAVEQFGLPDVFITLSPYEWSFPFPEWLENIRKLTGKRPTELAGLETAHIVHVLAQIVRGYLCGSNSKKWSKHVFSYNRISSEENVKTFFYRFEFQKRGTVHLHLLVWLKNITKITHQFIRADIPDENPDLSYLVSKYQPSDKPSNSLKLQDKDTFFECKHNKQVLHLKHPSDAFALNIRAYISTLLPALHCSMDFQTTDGRAMLLKYVTSYVTKNKDGIDTNSLYSYHVSGGQAAIRYVMDITPAEPEMWLALSSTKISWSSSRTKRYIVPSNEKANEDKTAEKYRNRLENLTNLSFLSWLRMTDHTKQVPKLYKRGNTLVGLKTVSFFNKDFFFQYILMHVPHRSLIDLRHPNHERIPESLQWYSAAIHHSANLWQNDDRVCQFLNNQGHRDTYITTCMAYVHTLRDMFFLWQTQIISSSCLDTNYVNEAHEFRLDSHQKTIHNHVLSAVNKRSHHYSSFARVHCFNSESDSDDDNITHEHVQYGHCDPPAAEKLNVPWSKPILVTGQGGCGKSYVIRSIVNDLIEQDASVLISLPTGFLASSFRATLPEEVTCDTVHASFHFPVENAESPKINWQLSNYDVLIIDEISMVPNVIFQHILKTLNVLLFRPVLMICGDAGQQQPFSNNNGKIMQISSPFDDRTFLNNTYHYKLTNQHRVSDEHYHSFLETVRKWVPSQELLNEIQNGRVISENNSVTDENIVHAYFSNPENTVLTFTKKAANHVNTTIGNALFSAQRPLLCAQLDCDLPPMPIYKGMRIVITQNRDKENGIVNGQSATVHMVQNQTILVKFNNGKIVPIYQVTMKKNSKTITVYPIVPGYATTICKAQGQTFKKVVLWLDIDKIPPGTAYVALSRVRSGDDISFLTPMKPNHFTPVSRLTHIL